MTNKEYKVTISFHMEKEYLIETTSREDAEHAALDQAFCESINASDLDVDIYVDDVELA